MQCAYCEEAIIIPVTAEKEIITCNGVETVFLEYCSEECRDDDQQVYNVIKQITAQTDLKYGS